jgi:MFS family permease
LTTTPAHDPAQSDRALLVRTIFAAALGSTLTWYDFFLYSLAATLVLGPVFFPAGDAVASQLMALATVLGGLVARPVGGALFGHLGDRIGRRATLIATLGLMGLASAAIGLAPSADRAGWLGAGLLVLLRVVQGLAAGGEWAASALLAMEWRPSTRARRGFIGSWTQIGVPAGLALACGALEGCRWWLGAGSPWAWRLPFLLGLLPLAVALFARLRVRETPVFTGLLEQRRIESSPVLAVLARQWREVVLTAIVRSGQQAPFAVLALFLVASAGGRLGLAQDQALLLVAAGAGVSVLTVPAFGFVSDVVGRRLLMLAGAVAMLAWSYPFWALLDTRAPLLVAVAIVAMLPIRDAQYAPQAALIAESFTPRLRATGAGIGSQLAALTADAAVPLLAALVAAQAGGPLPLAGLLAAYTLAGLLALLVLRDGSRLDLASEPVTQPRPGPVPAGPAAAVSRPGSPAGPGPR